MSYFEEGGTLPSPFNIIPSPKSVYYLVRWVKRHVLKIWGVKRLETFENLGVRIIMSSHRHTGFMFGTCSTGLRAENLQNK